MDCPEVQDPEGEYVQQWLPELVRILTEWIHHPWDAPTTVLQALGVELGSNYPKPIIDVDSARDRLREAIFRMLALETAARTTSLNDTDEVVGDSTEVRKNLAIPKVMVEDKAPCPLISSNDQRVPVVQNPQNGRLCKKRPNEVANASPIMKNLRDGGNEAGPSRMAEDLCSTAGS